MNYESAYKWYVGEMIERLIHDVVMFAELRPMFLDEFIPSDDGKSKLDNFKQMELLTMAVREKQKDLEDRGMRNRFRYGLKIIYCVPRSIKKEVMKRKLDECIAMKKRFPDLICGTSLHNTPH